MPKPAHLLTVTSACGFKARARRTGIAMIDKAIAEVPNNAGDLFDLAKQRSAA